MRVAVVQTAPIFAEKEENLQQALKMMKSVEADLYVLPELFDCGYNFTAANEVESLADKFASGRTFEEISKFVKDAKCFAVYGFAEVDGNSYYNAAAMVGYDGMACLYRKVHLFDRENLFFKPGNLGFRVYETRIGRVGMMICFDWYFPESARTLALRGAQLIAHPANLVLPNCPDGMRTRCLENRVFAVTANRIGTESRGGHSLTYIGQSQITSPRGEILHRAPVGMAEVMVKEVDLALADDKKLNSFNDLLRSRRPDIYECA